jgi:hypothetical protein
MEATLTTPFPVIATASWAAAILMLIRFWLRNTAPMRSTMDGLQLLLAIAVAMLPDARRPPGADRGDGRARIVLRASHQWRAHAGISDPLTATHR